MKILPVVLIALVASKAWSSDYAVPPENAVSWWRAENNAHDSLDGNNGTLINGAAFATGKIGQAFYFDGTSQYVEIGNSSNLNPASSFSIEGWICSRQDTPQEIMSKWTDSPAQPNQRSFNFFVYFDRSLGFAISDAAHQWDSNFHLFTTTNYAIPLNTWTHVAAVYDQPSGVRRIYINGVKVAERIDSPITVLNSTAKAAIGAVFSQGPAQSFQWLY